MTSTNSKRVDRSRARRLIDLRGIISNVVAGLATAGIIYAFALLANFLG
jgi:hypothetical protein